MAWRTLELYCGIGGAVAALGGRGRVVAAVDINRLALEVYRHNFPHPVWPRNVQGLDAAELSRLGADLWWLSPPCQPYTRRGLRRDDEDPRSRSLLTLLPRLERVRPPLLALENVPGFAASRTRERLLASLERSGYEIRERELCPSQLGIPNRRRRYYLLASRVGFRADEERRPVVRPLAAHLDPNPAADLVFDSAMAGRYRFAIDVVSPDDPGATTSCFTAAYGRSPVRSGSYLRTATGLRHFSPDEILRLLAFPPGFAWPDELPRANAWRLAGNSLSVAAVRAALASLPG